MLEDTLKVLPAIDQIANGDHLLMMKAAIPYLPQPGQQFMALYIKAAELSNILGFYQSAPDVSACSMDNMCSASPAEMLQDIRCFCSQAEQDSIDQCIHMFQMMNLYISLQDSAGSPDLMKSFLSPEQQSMFETYQTMFQTP